MIFLYGIVYASLYAKPFKLLQVCFWLKILFLFLSVWDGLKVKTLVKLKLFLVWLEKKNIIFFLLKMFYALKVSKQFQVSRERNISLVNSKSRLSFRENYTLPPSTITTFSISFPKLQKCTIDPPITSNCTAITPYGQNRVIIDGIVYHVTHTWSRTHQTTLYQFNFSENPEMPCPSLNKIWNQHYLNHNKIAPQTEILDQ